MQDRNLSQINLKMDVCDVNGGKIGSVAHVYRFGPVPIDDAAGERQPPREEVIEVKTGFLGLGRRLFIPMGAMEEVTLSCVLLTKTAEAVKHNEEWQYKPSHLDELH